MPIFNCMEVGAPNPCMVQESTIHTSFQEKFTLVQLDRHYLLHFRRGNKDQMLSVT